MTAAGTWKALDAKELSATPGQLRSCASRRLAAHSPSVLTLPLELSLPEPPKRMSPMPFFGQDCNLLGTLEVQVAQLHVDERRGKKGDPQGALLRWWRGSTGAQLLGRTVTCECAPRFFFLLFFLSCHPQSFFVIACCVFIVG